MMRTLWLALLVWCLGLPAAAQVVRVASGAHDGFSRLALQLPAPADWHLQRVADGYELRISGQNRYDISNVYRFIGRERLAAIWADPNTGALKLSLRCNCHAIPFAYRPSVIVVDLRDGPPPPGSAFELGADGLPMPPLAVQAPPRPRPRPAGTRDYDWMAIALERQKRAAARLSGEAEAVAAPVTEEVPHSAEPLREALLLQMSRGAAAGLVQMDGALPGPRVKGAAGVTTSQILITDAPGQLSARLEPVAAAGQSCPTAEQLALQDWAPKGLVALALAPARAGLLAEFDRPDPQAVGRATRFLLAIGFGAEARGMLDAFPADLPDAPLWRSLSYILDGERDPSPAFRGLAACETPAALWSLLTDPGPTAGDAIAMQAALAAFSALPPDLRELIGPPLAERLLSIDRKAAAETVRGAVVRAPGARSPRVRVMEADLALARGDSAGAEALARPVVEAPGPSTPEALAALVEARVAQNLSVSPEEVTTLEALLRERAGDASAARLTYALTLARAASGNFEAAFSGLAAAPVAEARLWEMLAQGGSDDALVTVALSRRPTVAAIAQAHRIAERLIGLGLGKAADVWLAALPDPDPLLSARAALAEQDGRAALRRLEGSAAPEADHIRVAALTLLGADAEAAEVLSRIGDAPARQKAEVRARDWAGVAANGGDAWRKIAGIMVPPSAADPTGAPPAEGTPPIGEPGPLARARALAEQSADDRARIEALLLAVAEP